MSINLYLKNDIAEYRMSVELASVNKKTKRIID